MEDMSLKTILEILKKGIAIILLFAIVFGGLAFGLTHLIPKNYKSYTTLLVGVPEDYSSEKMSMEEININRQLISTYGEFIKSRRVSEKVMENLGLDQMTYKEFTDKLNINLVEDSSIIKIEVKDTIALRARDIANETAEVFMKDIKRAMKIDNIEIIDYAVEAKEAYSPKLLINTAVGFILGILLGILFVFIRAANDRRIRNRAEIEDLLNLPVIGNIPLIK